MACCCALTCIQCRTLCGQTLPQYIDIELRIDAPAVRLTGIPLAGRPTPFEQAAISLGFARLLPACDRAYQIAQGSVIRRMAQDFGCVAVYGPQPSLGGGRFFATFSDLGITVSVALSFSNNLAQCNATLQATLFASDAAIFHQYPDGGYERYGLIPDISNGADPGSTVVLSKAMDFSCVSELTALSVSHSYSLNWRGNDALYEDGTPLDFVSFGLNGSTDRECSNSNWSGYPSFNELNKLPIYGWRAPGGVYPYRPQLDLPQPVTFTAKIHSISPLP